MPFGQRLSKGLFSLISSTVSPAKHPEIIGAKKSNIIQPAIARMNNRQYTTYIRITV
jgi:hypothetical protein